MQTRLYLCKTIFCPQALQRREARAEARLANKGQPRSLSEPGPCCRGYLSPCGLWEAPTHSSSSQPEKLERDARESGEPLGGLRGSSPSVGGGLRSSAVPVPRRRAPSLMAGPAAVTDRGGSARASGGPATRACHGRPPSRPGAPGPAPPRSRPSQRLRCDEERGGTDTEERRGQNRRPLIPC